MTVKIAEISPKGRISQAKYASDLKRIFCFNMPIHYSSFVYIVMYSFVFTENMGINRRKKKADLLNKICQYLKHSRRSIWYYSPELFRVNSHGSCLFRLN